MKTKLSICVVDDEPSNLAMMTMMLRAMGFIHIYAFSNAPDALIYIESKRPDLIVSDWNMEPMTGIELLKTVRNQSAVSHIPFLMVTANTSEDYWRRAIEAGATEFLFKPFSMAAFKGAVYTILGLQAEASNDKFDERQAPRLLRVG